jgi:hypothetical protein
VGDELGACSPLRRVAKAEPWPLRPGYKTDQLALFDMPDKGTKISLINTIDGLIH